MPRYARFGYNRNIFGITLPIPAGTALVENVTDLVGGFKFTLEKVVASVQIPGTGAGATRVLRVIKGASTVAATGTITLAGTAAVGQQTLLTVTADDIANFFDDADTLTIDWPAAGAVAFTAGQLHLALVLRAQTQR